MTSVKERLQVVLCKARGCKETTEDCNFKSCNSWGQCERIKEEVLTELPNMVKLHASEYLKQEYLVKLESEELYYTYLGVVIEVIDDMLNSIKEE